jgi:hypothetical protein
MKYTAVFTIYKHKCSLINNDLNPIVLEDTYDGVIEALHNVLNYSIYRETSSNSEASYKIEMSIEKLPKEK